MENATKFLYMAGGILISLLVFTIAIYLFRGGALMSAQYETKLSDEELKAYNSDFEAYAAKDYILASDIVSIINKAYDINKTEKEESNNPKYIDITTKMKEGEYKIEKEYKFDYETLKGNLSNAPEMTLYEFIQNYSRTDSKDNKILYKDKFKCEITEYYANGKVKSISFTHEIE